MLGGGRGGSRGSWRRCGFCGDNCRGAPWRELVPGGRLLHAFLAPHPPVRGVLPRRPPPSCSKRRGEKLRWIPQPSASFPAEDQELIRCRRRTFFSILACCGGGSEAKSWHWRCVEEAQIFLSQEMLWLLRPLPGP